jgi:oligoendopeptidase F
MEFSEDAANETSALVTALNARRSQESLASFLAFRKALEEVTRTIEAWAHVEPNDEVTDHVRRLAAEAQALADQRTEMAKATIDGCASNCRPSS